MHEARETVSNTQLCSHRSINGCKSISRAAEIKACVNALFSICADIVFKTTHLTSPSPRHCVYFRSRDSHIITSHFYCPPVKPKLSGCNRKRSQKQKKCVVSSSVSVFDATRKLCNLKNSISSWENPEILRKRFIETSCPSVLNVGLHNGIFFLGRFEINDLDGMKITINFGPWW